MPDDVLIKMIDHSYAVAVGKLPKKYQRELQESEDDVNETCPLACILTILLQNERVTSPELAKKFDVNRRTIQNVGGK